MAPPDCFILYIKIPDVYLAVGPGALWTIRMGGGGGSTLGNRTPSPLPFLLLSPNIMIAAPLPLLNIWCLQQQYIAIATKLHVWLISDKRHDLKNAASVISDIVASDVCLLCQIMMFVVLCRLVLMMFVALWCFSLMTFVALWCLSPIMTFVT